MFGYVVSGLGVTSDLMLPGLIERAGTDGPPDIVIAQGDVPTTLADATARGPNWQIAGDRFVLAVPGIVRMLFEAGARIVYALEDDTPAADAAIFVISTGLGILLQQRGRIVLHASAVRVGDGAVLFCGPSGAGKSTLAAALVEAGHDLLADDFCGVEIVDGIPVVHPDGRQLKLWQNAIDRLSLAGRRGGRVRSALQKYYVEPRAATRAALPLTAVYVLREARPPRAAGIVRVNVVDGALLIQRNAYRPGMVERMGQGALYFHAAAAIARHAGVFVFTRPLDFAQLARGTGELVDHWRERVAA